MRRQGQPFLLRVKNKNQLLSVGLSLEDRELRNVLNGPNPPNNQQSIASNNIGIVDKLKGQKEHQKRRQSQSQRFGRDRREEQEQIQEGKPNSQFRKTFVAMHQQKDQDCRARFLKTGMNNFTGKNSRAGSHKQSREGSAYRQQPVKAEEHLGAHNLYCEEIPQQLCRRPQTSKGQRKRGCKEQIEEAFNGLDCYPPSYQGSDQLITSKKMEGFEGSSNSTIKKKRSQALTANQKKELLRDANDLIKVNPKGGKRPVTGLLLPFQTSLPNDFLRLFANGR